MNLVSLDDMTAIIFGLGVARLDAKWELAVSLIAVAVAIRFFKAWMNGTPVSSNV